MIRATARLVASIAKVIFGVLFAATMIVLFILAAPAIVIGIVLVLVVYVAGTLVLAAILGSRS